jgi:hypothetical protein
MQITRDHASRALAQNRDARQLECVCHVSPRRSRDEGFLLNSARAAPASNAICTSCGRPVIETVADAATAAEFALDFIVAEHDTS